MQDGALKKATTAEGKVGLEVRLGVLKGWKQAWVERWGQAQRNFVHTFQIGRRVKEHEAILFCFKKNQKAKAKKELRIFLAIDHMYVFF